MIYLYPILIIIIIIIIKGCDRCGAGFVWSCCSSEDKDSKYCQGQISKLQAERNAKLFSMKAEKKLLVLEMKGYFPTTSITEWICICTVANPLQSSTCSVCDSQKPEHVREFSLETYESEWSELQSGEESLANKSVDQPESPTYTPTSPTYTPTSPSSSAPGPLFGGVNSFNPPAHSIFGANSSSSRPPSAFGVSSFGQSNSAVGASSFGRPSSGFGASSFGQSPSAVGGPAPRLSLKADSKSSKDFSDLFVKCKSFHKVDSIVVSGQKKKRESSRSRSKPVVGNERCSFRGPKCTSTPVLYCCKLCSPASYMCRGCYSDEDKKLQALMFKTEVSLYLSILIYY